MKKTLNRVLATLSLTTAVTIYAGSAMAAAAIPTTLYRSPGCGCCELYAQHLDQQGFAVKVVSTKKLLQFKQDHGVPQALASCHTMLVDGYVVEGHVPVNIVQRMLRQHPKIRGIALPGMPSGSPGMENPKMGGPKKAPFVVYVIADGPSRIYATQ